MNRRSMLQTLLAVSTVWTLSPKVEAQVSDSRDGNWWRRLDRATHLDFVVGFLDGMSLGTRFSTWGMNKTMAKSCAGPATQSYIDMIAKYFVNVESDQVSDGLDDFYKDYKNRSILIPGAVWLVVQGIAGKPRDELEKSIESWRKNAVTNPQ